MKIKQIRNATLKIEYGGKTFLIDGWMIDKQKFGRFADIPGVPFHTPDPVKMQIFQPDVVILNACAAELVDNGRLIMNDEDVLSVATVVPKAQIIISHMDNVAHATITRHEMRGLLARRNVKYFMPNDGETLTF